MKLCPASKPLIPAKILIEFEQNTENRLMYSLYINPFFFFSIGWLVVRSPVFLFFSSKFKPSSIVPPNKKRTGFGTTIIVGPAYETKRGRQATGGRIILYLHGRFSTSSANPRNIVKRMQVKAALYSTSRLLSLLFQVFLFKNLGLG